MATTIVTLFPWVALVLLIASFVPQIRRVHRTRSVKGLSPGMVLLGTAQGLWLGTYDFYHQRWSMGVAFTVFGLCFVALLGMYLMYSQDRHKHRRIAVGLGVTLVAIATALVADPLLGGRGSAVWVISFLGFAAGTLRMVPQTVKSFRSGENGSLSFSFFALGTVAVALGLAYELFSGRMSFAHLLLFSSILVLNGLQLATMVRIRARASYPSARSVTEGAGVVYPGRHHGAEHRADPRGVSGSPAVGILARVSSRT